jgi:hypothetical protein
MSNRGQPTNSGRPNFRLGEVTKVLQCKNLKRYEKIEKTPELYSSLSSKNVKFETERTIIWPVANLVCHTEGGT